MRRILLSFFLLLTSRSFAQFEAEGYKSNYPTNRPQPLLPLQKDSHFNSQSLVFEVRKSIPLSSSEKVARDYYINSGTKKGIRKGSIVKVYRKTAVYDPFYNRLSQDLKIEVAELKIIHVEHNVSIGRIYSVGESDEKVALDYQAPMVGDSLDVSSARMPGSIAGDGNGVGAGEGDPGQPQGGSRGSVQGVGQGVGERTLGDLKYLDPLFHQQIQSNSVHENENGPPDSFLPPQQAASELSPPQQTLQQPPPLPSPQAASETSPPQQPSRTKETAESSNTGNPPEALAKSAIKLEAGSQEKPSNEEEVAVQVQ